MASMNRRRKGEDRHPSTALFTPHLATEAFVRLALVLGAFPKSSLYHGFPPPPPQMRALPIWGIDTRWRLRLSESGLPPGFIAAEDPVTTVALGCALGDLTVVRRDGIAA